MKSLLAAATTALMLIGLAAPATATEEARPQIVADPGALRFENVIPGVAQSQQMTLRNTGKVDATLTAVVRAEGELMSASRGLMMRVSACGLPWVAGQCPPGAREVLLGEVTTGSVTQPTTFYMARSSSTHLNVEVELDAGIEASGLSASMSLSWVGTTPTEEVRRLEEERRERERLARAPLAQEQPSPAGRGGARPAGTAEGQRTGTPAAESEPEPINDAAVVAEGPGELGEDAAALEMDDAAQAADPHLTAAPQRAGDSSAIDAIVTAALAIALLAMAAVPWFLLLRRRKRHKEEERAAADRRAPDPWEGQLASATHGPTDTTDSQMRKT